MNFKQLRYFLEVVEAGSLSKAAIRCNVVQSALSQQIALLEQDLGKSLFIRTSKGVAVSAAGELFARYAKNILQQVEHARAVMAGPMDELAGTVSVGLPTSTATSLSALLLETCFEKYPGIHLRIVEGLSRQVHQALDSGSVDIAVLFASQQMTGLARRPLYTEELFVLKSSVQSEIPPGEVGIITLQELLNAPLLLPERGNGLRDWIDGLLHNMGLTVQPKAEIGSVNTTLRAIERGIGLSILPWGAFAKEAREGTIAAHRIEGICIPRYLQICTLEALPVAEPSKAVITLIQSLVKDQIGQDLLKHAYI